MHGLLAMYRERSGSPEFWAEPWNALSNVSFLLAAIAALWLVRRWRARAWSTALLIALAFMISIGSFLFHTMPSFWTHWLDIGPIALFQASFLWLAMRKMLNWPTWIAFSAIVGVIGLSFTLMPIKQPFNGSMSYFPCLLLSVVIGGVASQKNLPERWLILAGSGVFVVALMFRTIDWEVSWPIGTHFLWHALNGLTLYLAMRAWILFVACQR